MYKLQKAMIILFVLMISFTFYGCNSNKQEKKIQDKLRHMALSLKSYEVDATITFFIGPNAKGEGADVNVIKMKQKVELEGKYKLIVESPQHLKGYTTSFNGESITEYNPGTNMSVVCKPNEARNQTLFSTFIHNYLKATEIKKQVETIEDKEITTFEVDMPGDYKYMAKEKIWFDEKKLMPLKMEIYDNEGNLTIRVEFSNFKQNTEVSFNT